MMHVRQFTKNSNRHDHVYCFPFKLDRHAMPNWKYVFQCWEKFPIIVIHVQDSTSSEANKCLNNIF